MQLVFFFAILLCFLMPIKSLRKGNTKLQMSVQHIHVRWLVFLLPVFDQSVPISTSARKSAVSLLPSWSAAVTPDPLTGAGILQFLAVCPLLSKMHHTFYFSSCVWVLPIEALCTCAQETKSWKACIFCRWLLIGQQSSKKMSQRKLNKVYQSLQTTFWLKLLYLSTNV